MHEKNRRGDWFAASSAQMATSFQPSTESVSPEESDLVAAEQNERDRIGRSCALLLVDRLASDLRIASDGSPLPQSVASLGIHVGSVVRHLPQSEVADMVEGAGAYSS